MLSTFYPSMWLNSDWVSEVCTPFSPMQNVQSALEAAEEESEVESLSFLFRWALPGIHKVGQTLRQWVPTHKAVPNTWLSVLGTWKWHTLGHAAGLAPFRSKCSRIFLFLSSIIFSSANLFTSAVDSADFLHQLQCYFVFPKALPLAFFSLFCFA